LIDRLLAEIAYGYDVAPIVHKHGEKIHLLPLMTSVWKQMIAWWCSRRSMDCSGVETAQRVLPSWFLRIEKIQSFDSTFDAANAITRISGCELRVAREARPIFQLD